MTALRVLILDHTARPGGAELALERLVAGLDPTEFDVTVALFEDGELSARLTPYARVIVEPLGDATTVSRHDLLRRPLLSARLAVAVLRHSLRVRSLILREAPDLVVANSLKSGILGGFSARLAGVPFVWHLHDRVSADYLPAPVSRAVRLLLRLLPTHLVVNSRATLETVGTTSVPVTVAYPGVPADFEQLDATQRSAPPTVGIIGRISPTKGQLEFVRAAAELRRRGVSARYVMAGAPVFGEEKYAESVAELIVTQSLTNVVTNLGWLDDPRDVLAGLDVMVHASPVPEPFGQVLVEAMRAGVPVVATYAGGVSEILDPSGTATTANEVGIWRTELGQMVSPGDHLALADAVEWVLRNPEQAAHQAESAQDVARQVFSIESTVRSVSAAWAAAVRPG